MPTVLGFDPLFQFMHEEDAAAAICLALDKSLRGVFNVAGPQPMPLSLLIRAGGAHADAAAGDLDVERCSAASGCRELPPGAVAHLKYPVVIDDSSFRAATGFNHQYSEDETIAAFRDFTAH